MPDPPEKKKIKYEDIVEIQPPTSYFQTLANLVKGNIGTGCFAMAQAIKNGGLIFGPIVTVFMAIICIECMHMLVKGGEYIMQVLELNVRPDYAEVVRLCFEKSKNEKLRKMANVMQKLCNIAIVITQLGFCCVYFLFVTESIKLVIDYYGSKIIFPVLMTIVLIPIWLSIMVTQLTKIAIFSAFANACMIIGAIMTIGYSLIDLPASIDDRKLIRLDKLPLYFGTVLFAFEGIALVLPLQNAMKKPESFNTTFGVLNTGMVLVSTIYVALGTIGYWRYGEDTAGSLTLNLPVNEIFAQVIILMVALGVGLGYPIQFFVAIQIMMPGIHRMSDSASNHPLLAQRIFRTFVCVCTFAIAQLVPNLGLLLSLIGAAFCTILVFIFPTLIDLTIRQMKDDRIGCLHWSKGIFLFMLAIFGIVVGGGEAVYEIYLDLSSRSYS